jgi:hypothetical protein
MEPQIIKSFLDNFKKHYLTVERYKIDIDKARFNGLLSGWNALDSTMTSYEKRIASNYNIFDILNICNYEVITHSPFLTDLLNIKGEHKQGDLFYTEFLEQLQLPTKDKNKFIPNDKIFFSVEEPKYIGPIDEDYNKGVFIDILISYRDSKKHFAIAIENKIYARDQLKQLERYYKYLKDVHKENFLLVYLSPYGQDPTEDSIKISLLEELKAQRKIIKVISYQKQIKNLLEKTIKKIEAENVRSIINQYLQIIKKL